jgi:uncharacterized membrane protein YkoI
MNRWLANLSMVLVSLPLSAAAAEKPLAKSLVPKQVLQTATRSYPTAKVLETVTETDGDRTLYEVRLQAGDARVDLKIDGTGKLVSQERPLDPKIVPASIKNSALAPPYATWKIRKIEKVDDLETPGHSGYEVSIEGDGSRREIHFDRDGKFLKDEPDND